MNKLEQPLLFIMLPTFNRPKLILRAVNSILEQSYQNYYVRIFNDGSTEDYSELEQLIKGNPNIKYTKSENIGINKARNIMLDEFQKEYDTSNAYFCTFSDDDYFATDAFQTIKEELIKFKDKPLFCFNCYSLSQDLFINKSYEEYKVISYGDFRKSSQGDKHFFFNMNLVGHIRYPDRFFKNGYEHIFYFKTPDPIQIIPKIVKIIEYQEDGLSLSDLYDNSNSFKSIINHIRLHPTNIYYYKWLFQKSLKTVSPKNLLKLLITEDRYYHLKKSLKMKVPDKYK